MKRSILLSVGVMLLMSSMTLTTTAFGEDKKPVCSIREESYTYKSFLRGMSYKLYIGSQIVKVERTSFLPDKDKVVKAALEYEKLDVCTLQQKVKPICSIVEYKTDFLKLNRYALMIDKDSLGPRLAVSFKKREKAAEALFTHEDRGDCSIIQ